VRDYIAHLTNVCSAGRQGDFCFPNMHGAMRMGADAADRVLERMALAAGDREGGTAGAATAD